VNCEIDYPGHKKLKDSLSLGNLLLSIPMFKLLDLRIQVGYC